MTGRPILIGLTGSIGMGKSTTARMFAEEGIPVWDADAAVHRLYSKGGAAVPLIAKIAPDAVVDGQVDRAILKEMIQDRIGLLQRVESVVHPLVRQDREDFISNASAPILLMDIPLLYETHSERQMHVVVVVSAPEEEQRARVLARPGMTEEQFEIILKKQLPDEQKRARADFVIETTSLESARKQVRQVLDTIRKGQL